MQSFAELMNTINAEVAVISGTVSMNIVSAAVADVPREILLKAVVNCNRMISAMDVTKSVLTSFIELTDKKELTYDLWYEGFVKLNTLPMLAHTEEFAESFEKTKTLFDYSEAEKREYYQSLVTEVVPHFPAMIDQIELGMAAMRVFGDMLAVKRKAAL